MTLSDDNTTHTIESTTTTLTEQSADTAQDLAPEALAAEPLPEPHPDEKAAAPAPAEDFASALESFTTETEEAVREDRVLKGTVLKLTSTHVVVDIGAKSEGMLPLAEVLDHEGKPRFKPGDEIDVMREKGQTEEGYINLSHQKAHRLRAWDEIEKAHNEKKPVRGGGGGAH